MVKNSMSGSFSKKNGWIADVEKSEALENGLSVVGHNLAPGSFLIFCP